MGYENAELPPSGDSVLQIIGWLGCFYLAFRAVQMGVDRSFRNAEGQVPAEVGLVIMLGIVGAIGFAVWFGNQGSAISQPSPSLPKDELTQEEINCIIDARTTEETLACRD